MLSWGWYKVNADKAVFKELSSCGVGVVIRKNKGQMMGAMSKKMELPLGALEVEAKAVEEGIMLAKDLGFKRIIIEGDAQTMMMALSDHNSPPSSVQMIIEEAKRWRPVFSARRSKHLEGLVTKQHI
ncbi:hypothetical protein SO802_008694 [Lithocarpus litseifolius]|uniref:RNase H type-1 domain-containing protein n=1 Tax=Lithocarpus litseifolius TaxID=425828 RepID=A0AAW2D9D0_9ROSI